jgi:hypothetical protein
MVESSFAMARIMTPMFDLPGVITDQSGNEILHATLQNVKHVRSVKFNLFSLTKRQKDSWLLNGDSEKIWITKGEHKIVFDIPALLYISNKKQLK